MNPTPHKLLCLGPHGFYRLAYRRWEGQGRPVICVHGLSRNGRDFDALAARLAARGPVIVPDMPGRGGSDWLPNKEDYGYPLYLGAVAALIGSIGAAEVDFLGTSMGGLIGMMLAAQPLSPIRRLVINDVGPFLPKPALERIGSYVGQDPDFADIDELEAYMRRVAASFGTLSDGQWREMAEHSKRELPSGRLALHYDPAIGLPFQGSLTDVDLWPVYDRITCPTLVIRGGRSDLLLAETAAEMTRRGPKARLFEVPDAGHAPALLAEDQIEAVANFLGEA
ncbi:MAG TPA: alpha/beta hydrolase [Aliidongia sp.]|nr:alpha/beta hydrolase [Aliidongia sp.]